MARPVLGFQAIIPPADLMPKQAERVLNFVGRALREDVGRMILNEMKARVSSWEHKPDFATEFRDLPHRMTLIVWPARKNVRFWRWVSKGTKRDGFVFPVNAKALTIQTYNPSSLPGNVYGRSHARVGPVHLTGVARKSSIEARDFEGHIVNDLRGDFNRTIRRAFIRALSL